MNKIINTKQYKMKYLLRTLIIVLISLPFNLDAQVFKQGVISIDDVLAKENGVTILDVKGISDNVYFKIVDDKFYLKTGNSPMHSFDIDLSSTDRRVVKGNYLTRAAIKSMDTYETGELGYARKNGKDYWSIIIGNTIILMTDK